MSSNLTTTLSLLMVAAQAKPDDFEYRIAEIIQNLFDIQGWTDERKADLYALLADSVKADDTMLAIEKKVQTALHKNEAHFYGRVG